MNIKILIATHKKYEMPFDDIYLPIHVGKDGKPDIGYMGDNTLDNISNKNKNYCELTGIYWAWKNMALDYIGLCHYRRYFTLKKFNFTKKKVKDILNKEEIEKILNSYDIILPKKRNYYIETVYTHYKNAHYEKDLKLLENIIKKKYPDYIESFNNIMNGRNLYLYNMFIMDKIMFDKYCSWVFDILFELEKVLCLDNYDMYQSRVYGFLSERLFNVWLYKQNLKIKEINVINLEKINWLKKIYEFMKRKINGKKNSSCN